MKLALYIFAIIVIVAAEEYTEQQLQEASKIEALIQEEAQNEVNEQFKRAFFKFKPRYRINVAHKIPLAHHHRLPHAHLHAHRVPAHTHIHAHLHPHPVAIAGPKYKFGGFTKLIPVQVRPLRVKPSYGPPPAQLKPTYGPPPVMQIKPSYGPPTNDWKPMQTGPSVMWQLPPKHMILRPFKPSPELYPVQSPTGTKPTLVATPTPTQVTVLKPVSVKPAVQVRPTVLQPFPVQGAATVVHSPPPVAFHPHPHPVTVLRPTAVQRPVTVLQPVPVQQVVPQQQHVISQVPTYIPQNQLVALARPQLPVLPLGSTYESPVLKPQPVPTFAFGPPTHPIVHGPIPEVPLQTAPGVQFHPAQPAIQVHPAQPTYQVHPAHAGIPIQPTVHTQQAIPVQPTAAVHPSAPAPPQTPNHPFFHLTPSGFGINPFLFPQLPPPDSNEIHPHHIPQVPNEHPAQIPTRTPQLPGVPGENPFQLQPGQNQFQFQLPQPVQPNFAPQPLPQQPSQIPQNQFHGQLTSFPSHLLPGQNTHQFPQQFQSQQHFQNQQQFQSQQHFQNQQQQYYPPTSQRLFTSQGQQSQEILDSGEDLDGNVNINPKVLDHSPHIYQQQTGGQKPLSVQLPVHLPQHPNFKPDLSQFGPGATFSLHGNFESLRATGQPELGSDEKRR